MERIVPDEMDMKDSFDRQSYALHMERYRFAGKHIIGTNILDMACGIGYGSYSIATEHIARNLSITAVDIDTEAIKLANEKYKHAGIQFLQSDIFSFEPLKQFDTIISLETIEHLQNPERFLEKINTLLAPGGRLIISAPVTPSKDANPHHLQDFSSSSFRKLCTGYFPKEIDSLRQVQSFTLQQVLPGKKKGRAAGIRHSVLKYYVQHPGSLFKRMAAVLRYGFNNIYLTLVLEK